MGDTVEKSVKKSWFKTLKAEFKKIIWPEKVSVFKQTVTVVFIGTILAIIIAIVDMVLKFGLDVLA